MAVLPILVYGDARLETPSSDIESFDEELNVLACDLFDTGHAAPGLGVAAPQVGINIRLAVIDLSVGKDATQRIVLANPVLTHQEGVASLEEGCLSFPGLFTTIDRPKMVRVRAQDLTGEAFELEGTGLLAQAVCHELDHLDGVLLVNHLRGVKRRMFLRRVKKMRDLGVWPIS
jgi:peptide deformylase